MKFNSSVASKRRIAIEDHSRFEQRHHARIGFESVNLTMGTQRRRNRKRMVTDVRTSINRDTSGGYRFLNYPFDVRFEHASEKHGWRKIEIIGNDIDRLTTMRMRKDAIT